jgi:beta-lactamase class A
MDRLEKKGENSPSEKKTNPKKKRIEPWSKKERYLVLYVLLITVILSLLLAASARSWKLPGLPRISFSGLKKIFEGETIIIEKASEQDQNRAKEVIEKFKEKTKDLSGVYGLYVVDLETGFSYGVLETETFQAASLIKLPIMAKVYMEAEKGNLDLEAKPKDSSRTYRELVKAMGKKSDNSAQIVLVSDLGKEKIEETIDAMGMTKTSLAENDTTPADIGLFFKKLWQGKIVNREHKDELLGFLTDTIYEAWISEGIPDEIRVAHKFGREVHVVNDAGIVFTKKPFVVVIMSKGVVEREADAVFPELSRIVYEAMIK